MELKDRHKKLIQLSIICLLKKTSKNMLLFNVFNLQIKREVTCVVYEKLSYEKLNYDKLNHDKF